MFSNKMFFECFRISKCFTYRIYPFETFKFFCSCIRGRWSPLTDTALGHLIRISAVMCGSHCHGRRAVRQCFHHKSTSVGVASTQRPPSTPLGAVCIMAATHHSHSVRGIAMSPMSCGDIAGIARRIAI